MGLVVLALRVVLGGVLLAAGILKAHDGPFRTALTIADYRIVPPALIAPLGVALPYIEIMLGGYLLIGLFTRISGWVAAVQFVVFAIAVGSLVVRKIPADCGCFGASVATPPSWWHVALDGVAAIAAGFIAIRGPGAFAVDPFLFPSTRLTRESEAQS